MAVPAGQVKADVPLYPRVRLLIVLPTLVAYNTTSAVAPMPTVARFGAGGKTSASNEMLSDIGVMSAVRNAVGDPDLAGYIVSTILRPPSRP